MPKKPTRTPEQAKEIQELFRQADREASFLFNWQQAVEMQKDEDESREDKTREDDKDEETEQNT